MYYSDIVSAYSWIMREKWTDQRNLCAGFLMLSFTSFWFYLILIKSKYK